jgi:hypothetical protein
MVGGGRIKTFFSHQPQTLHPINTKEKQQRSYTTDLSITRCTSHQPQRGKNFDSTTNFYFQLLINVSFNKRIQFTKLQQHIHVLVDDRVWLKQH